MGRYQVYPDGTAQTGSGMSGMFAEAKGPGANVPKDNGKRIEPGRYPLFTHPPGHYATIDYSDSTDPDAEPKPCLDSRTPGIAIISWCIRGTASCPASAASICARRCRMRRSPSTMPPAAGASSP